MSQRTYKGTDAQMLIAAATIANSAIEHQAFLSSKRPSWNPPFFDNLRADVESVIQTHLGVENLSALLEATGALLTFQKQAITALAEAKVQIEVDFEDKPIRRQVILQALGITEHYAAARNRNQQALGELLRTFSQNLPAHLAELQAEGIEPAALQAVANMATQYDNLNITQEGIKGHRTEVTEEAVAAFEAIYKRIIGVCKIAVKFLKDQPAAKQRFSYTAVLKNITSKGNNPPPPSPPDTPA